MVRAASKTLLVAVGSAAVFGCATIFGLDPLADAPADKEGGAEAGSQSDADLTDAGAKPETGSDCTDPGYPGKPAADSPDGGDFTILVALNRIDFGLTDSTDAGPAVTSYNLDRICTVNTKTSSCISGATGTDYSNYVIDKTEAGADNAGLSLIHYISGMGPAFTPENINARLQAGLYGVIISVTAYNGQANDTQVNVNFFPSFGIATDGGVANAPTDVWRVDKSDLGASETSMWVDANAWVAGGKLVAHVPHAPLKITVDQNNPLLILRFDDAVVTGDIVRDGAGTFRLTHGVVAGRVKTQPFLESVDQLFYNPGAGPTMAICYEPIFQGFITNTVCSARDIMSNSLNDNTNVTCDAFSAGAGFDTYAVDKWSSGTAPGPADAGCAPVADCK